MTAFHRSRFAFALLIAVMVGAGCRKNEPPPTHYEDLGDGEEVLLPTSSTMQATGVAAGKAQWRPFREPRSTEEMEEDEAAGEEESGEVETELRSLVDDYHGTLADGPHEELPDFFVTTQSDTVRQVVETLSAFTAKLEESIELMPLEAENLRKLISHLQLAAALRLELGTITVKEEGEAVAALAQVPALSFLPDMPPAADIPREVRFTFGDDDYWYIESPIIPLLERAVPSLQQCTGVVDSFVTQAKADGMTADTLTAEAVRPVADALKPMIDAMNAPGAPAPEAGAEPGTDAPEPGGDAEPG